jgi:hypothetical protein
LIAFWFLRKGGHFHWLSAGFWAWAAFGLYFVASPFCALFDPDNLYRYEMHLYLSGGSARWLWVLAMIMVGIIVFFVSYMHTKHKQVSFNIMLMPKIAINVYIIMSIFSIWGFLSLLYFRSQLFNIDGLVMKGGHFSGDVTGWQYVAHLFLFIPTVFFLFASSCRERVAGYLIGILYIVLALPHAMSRYATLSMFLAMILVHTLRGNRKSPSWGLIITLVEMAAIFQIRGHATWTLDSGMLDELTSIVMEIPSETASILGSVDTAMLATFYFESYYVDTLTGYTYGLEVVNYILFGWIPSLFFPEKYFLLDWLRSVQPVAPVYAEMLLFGAKSSMIGSWYCMGNIVGVVLGMSLTGFLMRRLDGMVTNSAPRLVQTVGISWLALLWMVWGSHVQWGITSCGVIATPALFMCLVSRKGSRRLVQVRLPMRIDHHTKPHGHISDSRVGENQEQKGSRVYGATRKTKR